MLQPWSLGAHFTDENQSIQRREESCQWTHSAQSLGLLHDYYYQCRASEVPDTGLDKVCDLILHPTEAKTIASTLQRRSLRSS